MTEIEIPFTPLAPIRNSIAQTIFGAQFKGKQTIPPRIAHKVKLEGGDVLFCFEIRPSQVDAPMVVLAHGMGGCSESGYMRRIAYKLWQEGFGVFMVNHRGSGPGKGMASRLWNGGSSQELAAVVDYLVEQDAKRPLFLSGFSLSGNILLKYLGEKRNLPAQVVSAIAVNPPADLKVASKCISEGPWSETFNDYYMKLINNQMEAVKEAFPDAFFPRGTPETIYKFDVAYTAPVGGYQDVDEYYSKCSASQFLQYINIPTLILSAQDDPFVPPDIFDKKSFSSSIQYLAPEHGGHMGYLSKSKLPTGDRRWMDYVVIEWARQARGSLRHQFSLFSETERMQKTHL